MDNAVALVQLYLRVNGYFTVAEYPVVEAVRSGVPRSVTDLDVLAFRFPHAGHHGDRRPARGIVEVDIFPLDPVLGGPERTPGTELR